MARKFPVIGECQDVEGGYWYVRDIRETKHGFDLLFGSPISHLGVLPTGLPRLIATKQLQDFWEANRTKCDGTIYDLPAGRTTLKRVRRRLGFHWTKDANNFWKKRLYDLRTLKPREFAAKHNVDHRVVQERRRRHVGKFARAIGWWRDPRCLEILRSGLSGSEMARRLRISRTHLDRVRDRALEEYGQH